MSIQNVLKAIFFKTTWPLHIIRILLFYENPLLSKLDDGIIWQHFVVEEFTTPLTEPASSEDQLWFMDHITFAESEEDNWQISKRERSSSGSAQLLRETPRGPVSVIYKWRHCHFSVNTYWSSYQGKHVQPVLCVNNPSSGLIAFAVRKCQAPCKYKWYTGRLFASSVT